MGIRTYRARSMADAIDAVQRELGRDAIILHTRNYKVGGIMGLFGRPVVEVTASPASVVRDRHRTQAHTQAQAQAQDRARAKPPSPAPPKPRPQPRPPAADVPALPENPTSLERRRELLERYTVLASAQQAAAPPPAPDPQPRIETPQPQREVEPQAERMRVRASAPPPSTPGVEGELRSLRQLLGRMMHTQQAGPAWASSLGQPLSDAYLRLVEAEVDRDLADEVVSRVRGSLSTGELAEEATVRAAVLTVMAELIPVASPGRGRREDGPLTIALVGPTGVGKTTTIAKLAAAYKLRRGQRVGLITTDTFRIAAVEQLRTYASIISVPLRVVMSPAEMASACRAMADCDVVLIDTAGRSPRDGQRVEELSAYLAAAKPHETHLVLSATSAPAALRAAAAGFAQAGPDRILFTKLDEAQGVGTVLSMVHALDLPLSFVTTGQEVPDHIEPGRADRLARLALGVPAAAREPESARGERALAQAALP